MEKYSGTSQIVETIIKTKDEIRKSIFTVVSKSTSKDYTYKIKKTYYNGYMYIHVFVETEYMKWKYLGHYRNGSINYKGKLVDSPSALAIAWILKYTEKDKLKIVDDNIEFLHMGKCTKCNRALTDATSIKIGVGPICRSY